MSQEYSLVHLTNLSCPPPNFIYTAAKAGYDAVSLRTIPLGLPGEKPYDLARNPRLMRETRKALAETGIRYADTEIARIADGIDVKSHEPALEAAAEMGVTQILTNIWISDKERYTEQFVKLCQLAGQYGQQVNVEFVTWASVSNLTQTRELLLASGQKNVGIVVDTLHFYRSRVDLRELDDCPKSWFRYVHLCDCPREIPTETDALIHTGRSERLYPGEGAVPIREIITRIPNQNLVYGLEIPHDIRLRELGFEAYAKQMLTTAKNCMEKNKSER